MAKKVRRQPQEEEADFEFPEFDERAFLTKEYELGVAVAVAVAFAIAAGVVAWALTFVGVLWFVPFALGIGFVVGGPITIARLRPKSDVYAKTDWAALIALMLFGWLALWFVLVNVT